LHGRTILEICQKRDGRALGNVADCANGRSGDAERDGLDAPQMQPGLMDHIDSFLGGLIEGGYRLRICLEGALGNDERRKLGRDVHIGGL
jgi:hypothetical protein